MPRESSSPLQVQTSSSSLVARLFRARSHSLRPSSFSLVQIIGCLDMLLALPNHDECLSLLHVSDCVSIKLDRHGNMGFVSLAFLGSPECS